MWHGILRLTRCQQPASAGYKCLLLVCPIPQPPSRVRSSLSLGKVVNIMAGAYTRQSDAPRCSYPDAGEAVSELLAERQWCHVFSDVSHTEVVTLLN